MNLHSFSNQLPANTLESICYSAALSGLVAAAFNTGHPVAIAGIGALAALTHACASVVLKRLNIHPYSTGVQKTGLPYSITSSLQAILSVVLTKGILRVVGGPSFNVAKTAFLMIGLTLIAHANNSRSAADNATFIVLA